MTRRLWHRPISHRLSRRILLALLAVGLIPLAALTALVGADLTAVNQSTVNAARTTIVADARDRESHTAGDAASSLQLRLGVLTGYLTTAASSLGQAVGSATPAPVAVLPVADGATGSVGPGATSTLFGSGSTAVSGGTAADPIGSAHAAVAQALASLLSHEPELSAAWFYNSAAAELVTAPVANLGTLRGLLTTGQLNSSHPLDRQLTAAQQSEQSPSTGRGGSGRPDTGPAWSDIAPGVFTSGESVTVWVPLAAGHGDIGAELPVSAINAWVTDPVSNLPASWVAVVGPTGHYLYADALAASALGLPPDAAGRPAAIPGVTSAALATDQGTTLTSTEHGVARDLFTAPLTSPDWTLISAVPDNELAPAAASLSDGIRNGVRSILLGQVLPIALILGAIAVALAWLVSRRLISGVRTLITSAEKLASGRTDEPVPALGDDEVGLLSSTLERMRTEINTSREELLRAARDLEERVADRTAELSDRNEELVALNALGRTLTRSLDPDELLDGAVRTLTAILPADAVAAYTTSGGVAVRSTTTSPSTTALTKVLDRAAAAAARHATEPGLHTDGDVGVLSAPVVSGDDTLGVLVVAMDAGVTVPDRLRTLVGAVADQLALALRTAQLSAEGRELAVLEERTRLAREIHDTIAQQLTGIVLQLEATATLLGREDTERSHSLVLAARDQARLALAEARRSVWNLRPVPLDAAGLAGAVALEVDRFSERTGITATVRNHGVPVHLALPPQAEVAVFRILQEALSNVARHSRAARVDIDLRAVDGDLRLTVGDDGRGFSTDDLPDRARSFGLVGMRERAALIGAQFSVTSVPGGGTVVALEVPMQAQPAVADA